MIYPWQEPDWQRLYEIRQQNRLSHALLLTGQAGIGKHHFADHLAQFLLCQNPNHQIACGHCRSCHWIQCGHHPDKIEITLSENSKVIKIEQIRDLCVQLSQTSHEGGYQVVLIYPADQLNYSAANALLKILEEPLGKTQFLLVSDQIATIPPTILTRCQRIVLTIEDIQQTKQWLKQQLLNYDSADIEILLILSDYSPLRAKHLAQLNYLNFRKQLIEHLFKIAEMTINPLTITELLSQFDEFLWLHTLFTLVMDLLRLRYSVSEEMLYNRDYIQQLLPLSKRVAAIHWVTLLNSLNQLNQLRLNQANINWLLNFERFILQWEQTVNTLVKGANLC